MQCHPKSIKTTLNRIFLRNNEILGWCPAGSVGRRYLFTSWGKSTSSALVDHPSSDGVTIKMPYGLDALLH